MSTLTLYPLTSLPPQLSAALKEETDRHLHNIIRANITSCYACSSPHLTDFRLAIADKDVKEDSTTLSDFRRLVPLTDYEAYRPWLAKFMERPCRVSEVENLFAPGLPNYLGVSSSTSGSKPKHFARYSQSNLLFAEVAAPAGPLLGTMAAVFSLSYRDILDVTTEPGEVVKRIPICIGSAGFLRNTYQWPVETDDTRMANMSQYPFGQSCNGSSSLIHITVYIVPGHAAPWATGLISHHRSFLLIHALFALANPTLERISMTFVTLFMDMMSYMQEEWDMLLSSIRDGIIPDIDHIDHVRIYLQVGLYKVLS